MMPCKQPQANAQVPFDAIHACFLLVLIPVCNDATLRVPFHKAVNILIEETIHLFAITSSTKGLFQGICPPQ